MSQGQPGQPGQPGQAAQPPNYMNLGLKKIAANKKCGDLQHCCTWLDPPGHHSLRQNSMGVAVNCEGYSWFWQKGFWIWGGIRSALCEFSHRDRSSVAFCISQGCLEQCQVHTSWLQANRALTATGAQNSWLFRHPQISQNISKWQTWSIWSTWSTWSTRSTWSNSPHRSPSPCQI